LFAPRRLPASLERPAEAAGHQGELSVELRHLTPTISTEIGGVDLATIRDSAAFGEIRRLLADRGVLFFRNQELTAQEQLSFARLFGTPVASPHPKFGCVDGLKEVSLVINDEN